jgi:aryl sulfotransferase
VTAIHLLASYPKSGNTWVRAFMTGMSRASDTVDINHLDGIGSADRAAYDDALEVETSDLLPKEMARLRAAAFRTILDEMAGRVVVKTHDAWLPFPGTTALPFPSDRIGTVIFLVRDPRDVAVSLAHHSGVTLDVAIARMADPDHTIGRSDRGHNLQIAQYLSSWSRHALSWLNCGLRLSVIRYEDLLSAPCREFAAIARATGLPDDPERLARAIAASLFERLQEEEVSRGFREGTRDVPALFFRNGQAGTWRASLTATQAQTITRDHADVMRLFGYVP